MYLSLLFIQCKDISRSILLVEGSPYHTLSKLLLQSRSQALSKSCERIDVLASVGLLFLKINNSGAVCAHPARYEGLLLHTPSPSASPSAQLNEQVLSSCSRNFLLFSFWITFVDCDLPYLTWIRSANDVYNYYSHSFCWQGVAGVHFWQGDSAYTHFSVSDSMTSSWERALPAEYFQFLMALAAQEPTDQR